MTAFSLILHRISFPIIGGHFPKPNTAGIIFLTVCPGSNHFQSLTASNFEVLWPKDLKFSAFQDVFFFSIVSKVQEASSILRVGFALSKWPHFHRAYLVTVCKRKLVVYVSMLTQDFFFAVYRKTALTKLHNRLCFGIHWVVWVWQRKEVLHCSQFSFLSFLHYNNSWWYA